MGVALGSSASLTHVDFAYVDYVLARMPRREMMVVSHDLAEFGRIPMPLFDQYSHSDHVVNFADRSTIRSFSFHPKRASSRSRNRRCIRGGKTIGPTSSPTQRPWRRGT